MKNFSDFFTVYESKSIYLTKEDLIKNGYDEIESHLRDVCERTISSKTKVYTSRIQVYDIKNLRSVDAYEVHYYHIHQFNILYIESLVYSFYKKSGLKVESVYVTGDKGIKVHVSLSTDMKSVQEVTEAVDIDNLYKIVEDYVTIKLSVYCEVRLTEAGDEILRFNR